jgi:hypothetical protein
MSVKISQFFDLPAVAIQKGILARNGVIGCSSSQNTNHNAWLYPYKNYGIDNHFQYHLINYNEPTDYAAFTGLPPDNNGDDYELYPAITALCVRCPGTALRQTDDGNPSQQAPPGLREQR